MCSFSNPSFLLRGVNKVNNRLCQGRGKRLGMRKGGENNHRSQKGCGGIGVISGIHNEFTIQLGLVDGVDRVGRYGTYFGKRVVWCCRALGKLWTRAMISGRTSSTRCTSANDESRPREKRMRALAASFSTPMALRTWEGSSDPAEQAEPLEAQIPSKSSPASNAMLSQPLAVNATVLQRRSVSDPRKTTLLPSNLRTRERRRWLRGSKRSLANTGDRTNRSSASLSPMMPARFSVPARRSFSWRPPNKIGSRRSGDLIKSAPAPLGP